MQELSLQVCDSGRESPRPSWVGASHTVPPPHVGCLLSLLEWGTCPALHWVWDLCDPGPLNMLVPMCALRETRGGTQGSLPSPRAEALAAAALGPRTPPQGAGEAGEPWAPGEVLFEGTGQGCVSGCWLNWVWEPEGAEAGESSPAGLGRGQCLAMPAAPATSPP